MSNVAVIDQQRPREQRIQVIDSVPVLDTGRFDQMFRIARVMAQSNLIPDTLCSALEDQDDGKKKKVWLPTETVTANCFLIVNQAVGWGMDPFAVAQCASVVHGRVCYEGKLIAAVIEQKLGVRLQYEWNDKVGDDMGIIVRGTIPGETAAREMKGTVREWKTTGSGSPWLKQPRMQLAYRGSRDWGRLHTPSVMLGVYSDDEMEAVERQERLPARPMLASLEPMVPRTSSEPQRRLPPAPPPPPPAPPAPPEEAKVDAPKPPAPPASPAQKTPPAPPQAQQTEKPAEFNFDAFAESFRNELKAVGHTLDESNAVYERIVANSAQPLTGDQIDECDGILREHVAPMWSGAS